MFGDRIDCVPTDIGNNDTAFVTCFHIYDIRTCCSNGDHFQILTLLQCSFSYWCLIGDCDSCIFKPFLNIFRFSTVILGPFVFEGRTADVNVWSNCVTIQKYYFVYHFYKRSKFLTSELNCPYKPAFMFES